MIPVGAPLKAVLERRPSAAPSCSPPAMASRGRRTGSARRGRGVQAGGRDGVTFHDLRGTAVTRLAVAECTEPEIATITGTPCAACAPSSTPTTFPAIRRWPKARFAGSKGEQNLQTELQAGRCWSALFSGKPQ